MPRRSGHSQTKFEGCSRRRRAAQSSVERFYVPVFIRLSRTNEIELDTATPSPVLERLGHELGAVIHPGLLRRCGLKASAASASRSTSKRRTTWRRAITNSWCHTSLHGHQPRDRIIADHKCAAEEEPSESTDIPLL